MTQRAAGTARQASPARADRPRASLSTQLGPPHSAYVRWGKRLSDVMGASVAFVLLLPPMSLVALVVLLKMGSPVLFLQNRVGLGGREFRVFKFRTMQTDRRRSRKAVDADRRVSHKRDDDPRHTAVGRLLRRYSIDELPQLLNVIRGEMSLVGPRPELPSIVEAYEATQHARHRVRPGMTGLWQVSERGNGVALHDDTSADLDYVSRLSFSMDVSIMLKTLPAILGRRKGA